MKTLTIEYADTLHLTSGEFEREAKMAMAVKLFDVGRLTSGRAGGRATGTFHL